jgi:glucose/arabinose dehydrogenase
MFIDKVIICKFNTRIKSYSLIVLSILFLTIMFVGIDSFYFEQSLNNIGYVFAQPELIAKTSGNDIPTINNFNLSSGYTIKPVVWNLTTPDSITFDDKGNMYIGEAGYPFTHLPQVPQILKVTPSGNVSVFVNKDLNSPIVDIAYYNESALYVSHNHKISIVNLKNGTVKDIIVGLPTNLSHQNNQIAFSPDKKRLYVGIGSATNSGIVGEDDYTLGWLASDPKGHDVSGRNIALIGQNFITKNPLTAEPNDTATTGAYVPFGTSTNKSQVIQGEVKCNGCIISANVDGTDIKLVGWGLRNPTGLAFNEAGKLFAVSHGADERGSRPIANDSDKFYEIKLNETAVPAFYGWPDFFGNAQPVTDPIFHSPRGGEKPLEFLLQNHSIVEKPLMLFEPTHSSGIQMVFANKSFGFAGDAFVAQIGSDAPISRTIPPPDAVIGQNIVHVNIDNKTISDFLSLKKSTANFRPTDVAFSKNGSALFIVDWGGVTFTKGYPSTIPNSGIVWKVMPTTTPKINQQ